MAGLLFLSLSLSWLSCAMGPRVAGRLWTAGVARIEVAGSSYALAGTSRMRGCAADGGRRKGHRRHPRAMRGLRPKAKDLEPSADDVADSPSLLPDLAFARSVRVDDRGVSHDH
jgi:hypothetical protein